MLVDIARHVPWWVYAILAYLIRAGVQQSVAHRRTLARATLMPLALAALSLFGLQSSFAHGPVALLAWAGGLAVALVVALAFGGWSGVRWQPGQRVLLVPGSWAPLALMLGVFVVKFSVNVLLAIHPWLATVQAFVVGTGLVYGGFSGAFVSRGIAMWRATRPDWRSTPA